MELGGTEVPKRTELINGVVIEIDADTGRATAIERVIELES